MKSKTGWYNRNKTGNTVKHESHRHALASKGIKTSLPKGAKGVSFSGSPTPNFDMVKKDYSMKQSIYSNTEKALKNFETPQQAIKYYEYMLENNPESSTYPNSLREYHKGLILGLKGAIELKQAKLKNKKTDMVSKTKWFKKAVMEKPPYTLGGWKKTQSTVTRRKLALASRPKNRTLNNRRLSAGRSLQALANVTKDSATKRIAQADANYFFRLLKK